MNIANKDQEEILLRARLLDSFHYNNATICLHHELVFGGAFKRRVINKSYNIFDTHAKKVKGNHSVSLELAKGLRECGYRMWY